MQNKLISIGLSVLALVLGACAATSASQETVANSDPWTYVPTHLIHTDHSSIAKAPSPPARRSPRHA